MPIHLKIISLHRKVGREAEITASFFIHYPQMIDKNKLSKIVEAYLEGKSNYLVEVKIAPGNIITVEIDDDEGVNIDDCVALSQHIESKFDRNTEDYELTVTSVGLTAPFKTLRQYKKFEGKEVEVLTKKGDKLRGILKSANEDRFTITVTKKINLKGGKRKTEIQEDLPFAYDEVKYTKYHLRFK